MPCVADGKRREYGEDSIYFDDVSDCRDRQHHRGCLGRWRGSISMATVRGRCCTLCRTQSLKWFSRTSVVYDPPPLLLPLRNSGARQGKIIPLTAAMPWPSYASKFATGLRASC